MIFWDSNGVVQTESQWIMLRYIETRGRLENKIIKRVRPNVDQVLLKHDNARPHYSRATLRAIEWQGFQVILQSALQSGFNTVWFFFCYFLLPKIKEHLKVQSAILIMTFFFFFSKNSENSSGSQTGGLLLKTNILLFYSDDITKLVVCWQKCIKTRKEVLSKYNNT